MCRAAEHPKENVLSKKWVELSLTRIVLKNMGPKTKILTFFLVCEIDPETRKKLKISSFQQMETQTGANIASVGDYFQL